jgi:hypothetical protein
MQMEHYSNSSLTQEGNLVAVKTMLIRQHPATTEEEGVSPSSPFFMTSRPLFLDDTPPSVNHHETEVSSCMLWLLLLFCRKSSSIPGKMNIASRDASIMGGLHHMSKVAALRMWFEGDTPKVHHVDIMIICTDKSHLSAAIYHDHTKHAACPKTT